MESMENASINIDGKLVDSSLRNGYLALPLEPGEHKFTQIRAQGLQLSQRVQEESSPFMQVKGGGGGGRGAPTYVYVPGQSYMVYYTTLSVDRTFRIEPGKVTNLGSIIYFPKQDDPKSGAGAIAKRSFMVINLDNTAEINSFLEANYPELVKNLSSREIVLAPASYTDPGKLPVVRRAIALHELTGPHVLSSPNLTAVYGRAGTIVTFSAAKAGGQPAEQVFDTGTLADVVGATVNGETFTFLTSDAKLLELRDGKLARKNFPYRIQPVLLASMGGSRMLAVDNRLRVLTSANGENWNNFEGAMISAPRSDITQVNDGAGAYLALGRFGVPDAVYYLKAGESIPQQIPTPLQRIAVTRQDASVPVAREAGLFVVYNKPEFYFWSKRKQQWEVFTKPAGVCKPMRFDQSGMNLSIQCAGVDYQSQDSGATWIKQAI
jgi:hypothetical protein